MLELQAIHNARHAFWDHIRLLVVHILTNNTTMVYYVKKQGGAYFRSFCLEAINLRQFCIEEDITPVAVHLSRMQNHLADHLSRIFSLNHEWSLKASIVWIYLPKIVKREKKEVSCILLSGVGRDSAQSPSPVPSTAAGS